MERLSGDQKTAQAPSVPGTACMSSDASSRTQTLEPWGPVAVKASRTPSGEMAKGWREIGGANTVPGGGEKLNCTTGRAISPCRAVRSAIRPHVPRAVAPAASAIHADRRGSILGGVAAIGGPSKVAVISEPLGTDVCAFFKVPMNRYPRPATVSM